MSDPFVGEIRCYGFNFPPRGYALCNGQSLPIAQNTALFAILGTNYGGNGQTTFNLPNLEGSAACSSGQLSGGQTYNVGQAVGGSSVTLAVTQMPAHSHTFTTVTSSVNTATNAPAAGSHLGRTFSQRDFNNAAAPDSTLAPQMIGVAGGGMPHDNRQPFLVINFSIALQGIFPQRP